MSALQSAHPTPDSKPLPRPQEAIHLLPLFNFRVTEGGQTWKAIFLMIMYNAFGDLIYGRICSYKN